jgi:hypothetical protein
VVTRARRWLSWKLANVVVWVNPDPPLKFTTRRLHADYPSADHFDHVRVYGPTRPNPMPSEAPAGFAVPENEVSLRQYRVLADAIRDISDRSRKLGIPKDPPNPGL